MLKSLAGVTGDGSPPSGGENTDVSGDEIAMKPMANKAEVTTDESDETAPDETEIEVATDEQREGSELDLALKKAETATAEAVTKAVAPALDAVTKLTDTVTKLTDRIAKTEDVLGTTVPGEAGGDANVKKDGEAAGYSEPAYIDTGMDQVTLDVA